MHQFELLAELPAAEAFKSLYDTTGWGPASRDAAFYQAALAGSWRVRAAYAEGQLIGFVRAISDGHLHAFITEMIVRPEFQGQGVGAALLGAIMADCRAAGLSDIQLFCAKGKSAFYQRHGFVSRPADAPGMQFNPQG
ncbi:GNAT family N-acetyltransferase [Roseateles oligotrophus]|uniref:GNAT family N-acetyltransferase n=1 Tax=Roseateles oligotrophus TaxID=1769250 RepID=A0ABT2YHY1_9BURK|nr:GNAT family N-acetyltransferase [Roseateles oligotrophus]MCV2369680.1 GNAT family N-acetyltransferase [Roseateles oligotrophus]